VTLIPQALSLAPFNALSLLSLADANDLGSGEFVFFVKSAVQAMVIWWSQGGVMRGYLTLGLLPYRAPCSEPASNNHQS